MSTSSKSKIAFLCDWGEPSRDLLLRYADQTPDKTGEWDCIRGTEFPSEADYYVIMDGFANMELITDYSKVIYFQREPEDIFKWNGKGPFLNHSFPEETHFVGTYDKYFNVVTWWINLSFNELKQLEYPNKKRKISTVTSGKTFIEEHKRRLNFLRRFSEKITDIDVYGKGTEDYVSEKVFKGSIDHKIDGMINYEYSLVLENVTDPNTWSEKLADAYLSWSFPIFSGDNTLKNYFPEDSFCQIDLSDKHSWDSQIEEVKEFISKPPTEKQIEAMKEARELVLFEYNIWPSINRIVKGDTKPFK